MKHLRPDVALSVLGYDTVRQYLQSIGRLGPSGQEKEAPTPEATDVPPIKTMHSGYGMVSDL